VPAESSSPGGSATVRTVRPCPHQSSRSPPSTVCPPGAPARHGFAPLVVHVTEPARQPKSQSPPSVAAAEACHGGHLLPRLSYQQCRAQRCASARGAKGGVGCGRCRRGGMRRGGRVAVGVVVWVGVCVR